jgi:anti-anti-sigma factor
MPFTPKPLTYRLEQHPDAIVLHLAGDAGATGIDALAKASAAARAQHAKLLVIDGSQVGHVGSMAVGVLMRLKSELAARGTKLAIAATTPDVTQLLKHLNIEKIVPLFATVADALKAGGDPGARSPA